MKFKQFINEEMPIIDSKHQKEFEYLGAMIKYKDRYKELFKEGDRVYIPIKGTVNITGESFNFDIQDALIRRINELEDRYKIDVSFHENYANNTITFKLMTYDEVLEKKIKGKEKLSYSIKEFVDLYGTEAEKTQLKSLPSFGKHDKLMLVISRNPCDIGSMSTGTHWSSCMNLYNGVYNKYTREDVRFGTLIVYLTDVSDKDIKTPLGRKLIKPYINYGGKTRQEYLVLTKPVYGMFTQEAERVVQEWLDKHQKDIEGYFEIHRALYQDDDITSVSKWKDKK